MAELPWKPSTALPNRVPPRECIAAARDALNKAYGCTAADGRLYPFLLEALDWQRRAIEQIAQVQTSAEVTRPARHGTEEG